jgi:hypothetical protein
MPSIITNKARVITAQRMLESFQDEISNTHYMFAADHIDGEATAVPPDNSEDYQYYKMSAEIIFGKKIQADDVALSVRFIPWESGKVFSVYDNRDANLINKDFYCFTKEGSNYSVFKCIENNYNKPSTHQPKASETNLADPLYRTNDGYIWKLLYTVSEAQYKKFAITGKKFPLFPNAELSAMAVPGSINSILVENGGSLYNSYLDGSFRAISISGNSQIHSIQSDNVMSANTDFYKNNGIYIYAGTGAGQLREIQEYVVTGSDRRIVTKSAFTVAPDLSSKFNIAPFVRITGDGSGAEGIVSINAVSNSIHSIQMINIGKDYSFAKVDIISNTSSISANSISTTTATTRAILSPQNGHGYSVAKELNATALVISVSFDGSENGAIPITNDFQITGVLLNPQFANTVVTVSETNGYTVGAEVKQTNGFHATVSGVNIDGAKTLRLTKITGIPSTDLPLNLMDGSIPVDVETIDRNLSLFDNRSVYSVDEISPLSSFIIDEQIFQTSSGAYGYLHTAANNAVYLTGVKKAFTISDDVTGFQATFTGKESTSTAKITGYSEPALINTSGECLYIQSAFAVTRDEDQTERIKITIEF